MTTLESLVGTHNLTGVAYNVNYQLDEPTWFDDKASAIYFTLDNITYVAIEDAADGYRGYLGELKISDTAPSNMFAPIAVLARMQADEDTEILELIDLSNGKIILEIGTEYHDAYYPQFVSNWIPQNLRINSDV